jgi:hypothetical protein
MGKQTNPCTARNTYIDRLTIGTVIQTESWEIYAYRQAERDGYIERQAFRAVFLKLFLDAAHYFCRESSRQTNVRGGSTAGDSGLHAHSLPSAVVISGCLL